jgi:S1-C subfamily serine protease
MQLRALIAAALCLNGIVYGLTRREVFSNSAVHLSITCGNSTGSGFLLFRPADPSNSNSGNVFLVTNKHVLPAEGRQCDVMMRVSIRDKDTVTAKTVTVPVVSDNGKYRNSVRVHNNSDIAAINVTRVVAESGMPLEFVPTGLLGTKERLKKGNVALVGDEIYVLGYPAGLYDKRNAFPIWRVGIISTSPLLGYTFPDAIQKLFKLPSFIDGFLIDAHIFPGSSGSAVVVKPQPISFDSPSGVIAGGARSITYVLGIVSRSIPYGDFGGTVPTRIGIGVAESADAINDAIEDFFRSESQRGT